MMNFLLRRLGFYLLAGWASITLNFFLPRFMPGDPATALVSRMQGRVRPETIDAIKQAYGLSDDPLYLQYLYYIRNLFRGEFGTSMSQFPAPVTEVIGQAFAWTILLGLTTGVISFVIGMGLGILGAWRRGGMLDSVMPPLLIFIGSFPYFWLASLALFFLSFEWGFFPLSHAYDDDLSPAWTLQFVGSVGTHLFLPAMTIIVVSIGGWVLGMRNTMIATLSEDYVTMAEAKGV
jgi:peptide/nickel transport system permease protein